MAELSALQRFVCRTHAGGEAVRYLKDRHYYSLGTNQPARVQRLWLKNNRVLMRGIKRLARVGLIELIDAGTPNLPNRFTTLGPAFPAAVRFVDIRNARFCAERLVQAHRSGK